VSAGEPLPDPWPIFGTKQMYLRRGSMTMIAGPPGSMKTVLALNIVRRMGPKVPTLYHSSDSDSFTVGSRVLAMKKNMQVSAAEELILLSDKTAAISLKDYDHVRWSFRSSPTVEHMWNEAEAYRTLRGTYPHHTVIDILMDVDYEGAGEQNYWSLMAELKDMARDQETALTIVHHTSESFKGGSPPPRNAIMGKANQSPTLILTLWGDSKRGTLDIAAVKNRGGPQDPMADSYFTMRADPATCFIDEAEPMEFDSKDTETEEEWMP
jgi:hypothetical protein